jgi:hypothetical protein
LWTVNLASWVTQQPLRALGVGTARAIVTFGAGGVSGAAREIVEVDYPSAGTAFHVAAADIAVELAGDVTSSDLAGLAFPPILGAWLSNTFSSQRPMAATLTEATVTVGPSAGAVYRIPPRARSFRFLYPTSGAILSALQLSNNATPVTVGNDVINAAAEQAPSDRSRWYPLGPEAGTLVVTNNNVGADEWRVQWLLELG